MGSDDREPHTDTDPRRAPDPNRVNMPEGLRRERKSAYGPSGRYNEKIELEKSERGKGGLGD